MIHSNPDATAPQSEGGADRSTRPIQPDQRQVLADAAALAGGAPTGSTVGLRTPPVAAPESETALVEVLKVLRTPEERFAGLLDYPFQPHYVWVGLGDGSDTAVRVHYVDERPRDGAKWSGETILLLHGNPSWSYLYRHVIPPLVAAGHRCVALDLVGMGKSDKPTDRFLYTYRHHMDWLTEAVFDRLDLRDVTLVCHDWGGLLGLRLLAENPDRFRRVVASNTSFKTGKEEIPAQAWQYLAQWLQFSQRTNPLYASQVVDNFTTTELDSAVRAAYDAPYPGDPYQHAVRRFAVSIPLSPHDEATPEFTAAWEVLTTLQTPFMCLFSDKDHVTGGDHSALSDHIPGAAGQPHTVITGAHHFLQEDKPAEFAAAVNSFIQQTCQ
ncbi:haloalkane dehalogenase [Nonomuraea turcica]|uniref:haloalkane dehalogenase n=1 Tax=Nonomuraea sp. G32 TaxID=3067274 RepID=UPI00273B6F5B|nr:haloalkane dehalogenase [Nonomuraea sp. G32]MDP4511796.1 haloalkane dehalogenase [Nonomuraea sp. G32]